MRLREIPLPALRSFAAAAQWTTLSRAAEELGVTHGAVSRQIGKLEDWLGQELFTRQGRQLVLTPAGEFLASKIENSLTEIMSACQDIAGIRKRHLVTVDAPTSFAIYWLLPRLTDLESQVDDTEVSVATRMSNQTYEGPLGDVVITRGASLDRRLQGFDRFWLMQEHMTLLASPCFIATTEISSPADVLRHQKVGTITRPTDWPNWLRVAGLGGEHVRFKHRFDHLFVALQAVRDGIGTIVAPQNILVCRARETIFVTILPEIELPGESYYIYTRSNNKSSIIMRLVDFLRESAASGGCVSNPHPVGAGVGRQHL